MAFLRRKVRPVVAPGRSLVVPPMPEPSPPPADRAVRTEFSGEEFRALVVCTANVCRSPLAQALLQRALFDRGVPCSVTSAGCISTRHSVDLRSVEAARITGQDLSVHQPRQITRAIVDDDGADVVLTMGREHGREVGLLVPSAVPRTFTLLEFVRRAASMPAMPGEASDTWVARLSEGRRPSELLGEDRSDDIVDPYQRPDDVFRTVAAQLQRLTIEAASAIAATSGARRNR